MIDKLYQLHKDDIRQIIRCINKGVSYIDEDTYSAFTSTEKKAYIALDDLQQRMFSFFFKSFPRHDIALRSTLLYSALFRYNMTKTTYGKLYEARMPKNPPRIESLEWLINLVSFEDTIIVLSAADYTTLVDFHFKILDDFKIFQCSIISASDANIRIGTANIQIPDDYEHFVKNYINEERELRPVFSFLKSL